MTQLVDNGLGHFLRLFAILICLVFLFPFVQQLLGQAVVVGLRDERGHEDGANGEECSLHTTHVSQELDERVSLSLKRTAHVINAEHTAHHWCIVTVIRL